MSRVDGFFLSEEFITNWGVDAQWVWSRDIADHRLVWLKVVVRDWDPKPFWFNNCWIQHETLESFSENCWANFRVNVWKWYVLKEKFKRLKFKQMEWNKGAFEVLNFGKSFKQRRIYFCRNQNQGGVLEGDVNRGFFHSCLKGRRRRN